MDAKDLENIQDKIGYHFKNSDLLQQAFVRRSYSNECGGENNEALEFIGDKVLDFIVVILLTEKYGSMASDYDAFNRQDDWDEFKCSINEGKLTELKKRLVEKTYLAGCIDNLGFAEFLIMGKGDRIQNNDKELSVKEDLFEAILGAVALDSGWNVEVLKDVVEVMLNPDAVLDDDKDDNYVRLIQEWCADNDCGLPSYSFNDRTKGSSIVSSFNGITAPMQSSFSYCFYNSGNNKYECILKINDDAIKDFKAYGKSMGIARRNVCKFAYEWLEKNDFIFTIADEIENPNREDSIGQLETLARRGYFSIPDYKDSKKYDSNGNPIWTMTCRIEEIDKCFTYFSSSKKSAKKDAAYAMLMYVLEN